MSRMHGSQCRVYLGGRDISGDIQTVTPNPSVTTHDVTTFASAGWIEGQGGLGTSPIALEGFYDPAVGGFGRQMEDLLGASGGIVSVYEGDANAIGDNGFLFGDGVLSNRSQPISVNDIIKLSGTLGATGRPGLIGRLLHPLGQETVGANSASLDNAAQSTAGGRATVHITAITGTWTVTIQQSSDNGAGDAWATLATFAGKTAIGAFTAEVTGTVERYLRCICTEDVAGSCTFIAGFARY